MDLRKRGVLINVERKVWNNVRTNGYLIVSNTAEVQKVPEVQ